MSKKFFLLIILYILILIFFSNSKEFSSKYNDITEWEPDTLYDYTKDYFLSDSNPYKSTNLKHMIVDPENYLEGEDLEEINLKMSVLFDEFKINNYIFIMTQMKSRKKKYDDMEYEKFISKFNYIMLRDNNYFEDNMTLTTFIFTTNNKIKIKTGRALHAFISKKDISKIVNILKLDIENKKYFSLLQKLVNNIIDTYIENERYFNSFYYKNRKNIFIFGSILVIFIISLSAYINYVPEGIREQKIESFINRYDNKKMNKVTHQSCILCLLYFMSDDDRMKIENLFNKKKLKQEETTILKCGHKFHTNCINEWFKHQEKCPLCKISVNFEKKFNKNTKVPLKKLTDNRIDLGKFYLIEIIKEFLDIQREAFPHEINELQCNRIAKNHTVKEKNL